MSAPSASYPESEAFLGPRGGASVPPPQLRASVLVVGYNGASFLPACLDSLLAMDMPSTAFEMVYIDNASFDASLAIVERCARQFAHMTILRNPRNLGFAAAVNQAAKMARAPILVVLNQDTIVANGWLRQLIRPLEEEPSVAVVGARVLYEDGSGLYAGALEVLYGGVCIAHEWEGRCDAVSACAMAVRRDAFLRLGGFHEDLFMYGEDLDLCHRARRAGYRIAYAPESIVYHRASRRERAGTRTYVFYMARNRTLVCLRNYRRKRLYLLLDLFALFPLTAGMELLRSNRRRRALRWVWEARVDSVRRAKEVLRDARSMRKLPERATDPGWD